MSYLQVLSEMFSVSCVVHEFFMLFIIAQLTIFMLCMYINMGSIIQVTFYVD